MSTAPNIPPTYCIKAIPCIFKYQHIRTIQPSTALINKPSEKHIEVEKAPINFSNSSVELPITLSSDAIGLASGQPASAANQFTLMNGVTYETNAYADTNEYPPVISSPKDKLSEEFAITEALNTILPSNGNNTLKNTPLLPTPFSDNIPCNTPPSSLRQQSFFPMPGRQSSNTSTMQKTTVPSNISESVQNGNTQAKLDNNSTPDSLLEALKTPNGLYEHLNPIPASHSEISNTWKN